MVGNVDLNHAHIVSENTSHAGSADGTPGITIAISTRNRTKYLRQTLESLRRQSVPPFEILIQNDGGSDETFELVESSGLNIRYF